jgi:hypothetical protein
MWGRFWRITGDIGDKAGLLYWLVVWVSLVGVRYGGLDLGRDRAPLWCGGRRISVLVRWNPKNALA